MWQWSYMVEDVVMVGHGWERVEEASYLNWSDSWSGPPSLWYSIFIQLSRDQRITIPLTSDTTCGKEIHSFLKGLSSEGGK